MKSITSNNIKGLQSRFAKLNSSKNNPIDTLKQNKALRAILNIASEYLKDSDHSNDAEKIAHFLMGKISYKQLPEEFKNTCNKSNIKLEEYNDSKLKDAVNDLLRTHRYFLSEKSNKTIEKINELNNKLNVSVIETENSIVTNPNINKELKIEALNTSRLDVSNTTGKPKLNNALRSVGFSKDRIEIYFKNNISKQFVLMSPRPGGEIYYLQKNNNEITCPFKIVKTFEGVEGENVSVTINLTKVDSTFNAEQIKSQLENSFDQLIVENSKITIFGKEMSDLMAIPNKIATLFNVDQVSQPIQTKL